MSQRSVLTTNCALPTNKRTGTLFSPMDATTSLPACPTTIDKAQSVFLRMDVVVKYSEGLPVVLGKFGMSR